MSIVGRCCGSNSAFGMNGYGIRRRKKRKITQFIRAISCLSSSLWFYSFIHFFSPSFCAQCVFCVPIDVCVSCASELDYNAQRVCVRGCQRTMHKLGAISTISLTSVCTYSTSVSSKNVSSALFTLTVCFQLVWNVYVSVHGYVPNVQLKSIKPKEETTKSCEETTRENWGDF